MLVGLVANPSSSKDIRRLTTLARVVDVEEKANLVARLLVGVGSEKGVEVIAVDDAAGVVRRGVVLAGPAGAPVGFLPMSVEGTEADSRNAASHLAGLGAAALVTVGGDGTVRAAVEGWRDAPLVPLAAGTNNAFALSQEPSVVGWATALAVTKVPDAFRPTTAIEVETAGGLALAVIDAVAVRDRWVGAGALSGTGQLLEGLVTSSRRTAVGIASVSAAFGRLEDGHARYLRFGGDHSVRAVFGPGVVLDIPVDDHLDLAMGAELMVAPGAGLIALDGERRLPAKGGMMRVIQGPRLLDIERATRAF